MSENEKYHPYWPETVIFWGAGTTEPLKIKTTKELGRTVQVLAETGDTRVSVNQAIPEASGPVRSEFAALLELIDASGSGSDHEAMRTLSIPEPRARQLQTLYDWHAVKRVIERCPHNSADGFSLDDLYNLLDLHIQTHKGIEVDGEFVTIDRLIAARRTLTMLTQLLHAIGYAELLHDPEIRVKFQRYRDFARMLTHRMSDEGVRRAADKVPLEHRQFYLFSYAVISMNWDPLLLWLILNAQKDMNDAPGAPEVGNPPQPMKLFSDLAHFITVRKVEGSTPSAWYPMNETAVQQLNDEAYSSGRRVRIGKFYFPHGCHGFRQCPKCGKLTFYLGDEWRADSPSLFPPQILPSLSSRHPRSFEEKKAMDAGIFDAVQCASCGTITETHHTVIEMQTGFKIHQPSFIQEIQNDMKVAIENARHIIFAGYSLPNDDFADRLMLSARRKKHVRCSVIGFDHEADDRWLYGAELNRYCHSTYSSFTDTLKRVASIFGEENVRGYGAGFPGVFMHHGKADARKIENMMRVW